MAVVPRLHTMGVLIGPLQHRKAVSGMITVAVIKREEKHPDLMINRSKKNIGHVKPTPFSASILLNSEKPDTQP